MTAPTVTVGGPPAAARHLRSVIAVEAHLAPYSDRHEAMTAWWAAQHDARRIHVYELDGRWHVLITDGFGRWVTHATPDGLGELDSARRVAGHAWLLLREGQALAA